MANISLFKKQTLFILLSLCISPMCFSQSPSRDYLTLNYFKVKPENSRKYLDIERNTWKKIHKERLKSGSIKGWYLYSIIMPRGTDYHADYVTVNMAGSFSNLAEPYPDILLKKYSPKKDISKLISETSAVSDMVSEQIIAKVEEVPPAKKSSEPARYCVTNYFHIKPENREKQLEATRKYWIPIHQELVKTGVMHSWTQYSVYSPFGDEHKTTVMTMDRYYKFSSTENPFTDEVVKKVHAGNSQSELLGETSDIGDFLNIELWELVDYVD